MSGARRPSRDRPGRVHFWPVAIVVLLAGNVLICAVTVVSATRDPAGSAVEPDYYKRAMDWDEHAAERRASEQLGWIVHVGPGADDNPGLTVRAFDAEGGPVTGASVHATVYHRARSGEPAELTFAETVPGVYVADFALDRDGLWQVEMSIERTAEGRTERYVAERTLDVHPNAAPVGEAGATP